MKRKRGKQLTIYDAIMDIKDQGKSGAAVAFAATAMVEAQLVGLKKKINGK